MAAHIKKLSLFLVAALVLVGSFSEYRITQAVVGEGTATIDGAGNVTVSQAVTHKFTVILTVGASGITADAENPTFTIPAGFTAPDHFPVASAGAVTADGNWFVAGGATCVIDSPSVGLTATSGQVITVDVTTACTVGAGGKITLTYQGQSAATMAATPLNIGTNDVISYVAVTPISAPPTITVIAGATPTPTPTPTPSATPTPTATPTATPASGGSQPATINVVKTVINDNGKTKIIADFPLFVNGTLVVSGVTNTFPAIGGIYTVTETGDSNYTRTFSGDCDANGQMNLTSGQNKFCIVTNNDIGAPIAVPPVPPLIDVVKVPSSLALPGGPGPVTYTYTLTNIGTVPVTNITMVGDTCSPIVLASGDTNGDVKLQVSETWTYRCTTSLSATHTNIVTTTGWANGISAVDIATATVVVGVPVIPPLIHVVKVPSLFTLPAPGGTVTYRYTVTNSGTAPLSDVTITDDKCTGLPGRVVGHPGDTNKNDLLESNESWSFTCQSNLTQTTTNTATVAGTANGLTARDFAVATVVVAAAPNLPSAGIPPSESDNSPGIITLVGILAGVLTAVVVSQRKQVI